LFGIWSFLLLIPTAPIDADVVIRGAMLHDGSGKPGDVGDLAIKGERIVGVGTFEVAGTPRVIDGKGMIVAPGFIDLHTHSDIPIFAPDHKIPIAEPGTRNNLNYLTQGVTTIVTGNCGSGPVDVADYLRKLDAEPPGSNVCHLVPHNDLRIAVMGNANRPPSGAEMEKMKALVDRGMRVGAWGLATGLYYTPGSYASTEEVIELARVAAEHGGIYASHMRDEGAELLPAIHETLRIGTAAKLPVHISHMKAWGRKHWDKAADAIALVEQARARGQTVTADQYPYVASSTALGAYLIPTQYREGTQDDLIARFDDAEQGPKVRAAIESSLADWDGGRSIRLASYPPKPEWQGKDVAAIAEMEKKTPLEIVLEVERHGGAVAVNFSMNEEGVRLIMKQPFVATASDGGTMLPSDTFQHPRSYGTFPRKIGYYSLEEKVVPLEQAIRSASGLPGDILRLPERGYLKIGYFADVVVFDPATFRDTATFDRPHQYSTGVKFLFVNGTAAIDDGKFTEKLAGKALRLHYDEAVANWKPSLWDRARDWATEHQTIAIALVTTVATLLMLMLWRALRRRQVTRPLSETL
jgi:N-acyl-D-aspartate/D-glutamate deacylase